MKLFLIRHGQTDWNVQGKLQGHSDIPLNAEGISQAERAAQIYERFQIQEILSSDLQRAKQTAQILANHWKIQSFEHDPRFREVHLGEAEGISRDLIKSNYGEKFYDTWASSDPKDFHVQFPQGETRREAAERFLEGLRQSASSSVLAIVSHGLVLKSVVSIFVDTVSSPFWIQNLTALECEWEKDQLKLLALHQIP